MKKLYKRGDSGAIFKDNGKYDEMMSMQEVMDCLNDQQTIIDNLKQENEKLKEERQRLIYHLNKEPKR